MEVKIGVQNVSREVVLESEQTSQQVATAVQEAIKSGEALELTDEKGRRVIVPVNVLGYVEIGAPESRRVGFGIV